MRTFYYHVDERSKFLGDKQIRVYLSAKPNFSLREILSKQEQFFISFASEKCPFNKVWVSAQRHPQELIEITHLVPYPLAIRPARMEIDRNRRICNFKFWHYLEFVLDDDGRASPSTLIEWLKTLWKGEWKEELSAEEKGGMIGLS